MKTKQYETKQDCFQIKKHNYRMKKKYHGGSEQEIDYCRKPKQKNSENSPRTYKKFRHKHDMQIYKGIEFLKP